jgi:hypothetical protein
VSALGTPTLVVLVLFALVSVTAVLAQLVVCFRGWPGQEFRPPVSAYLGAAARAVLGFLERTFRDIVEGFKDGVEWLVYGVVTG